MSVIVELTLPAREFELGRILEVEGEARIVLETMVPVGEKTAPFFRVYGGSSSFEEAVRGEPSVSGVELLAVHEDEALYALEWDVSDDSFFQGIERHDATVLQSSGSKEAWGFELRFRDHDTLSSFNEYCQEHDLPITVLNIFNPTKPDSGPWFGLTPSQRTALIQAVEEGYYAIPRRISTQELASEFSISDQAMTERLRRGIGNLVKNTLFVSAESEQRP